MPDGYLQGLQTTYNNYQTALESAGVDGATAAGVEFTHLLTQLAMLPATVATAGAAAGYTTTKVASLLDSLGASAKVAEVVDAAGSAAKTLDLINVQGKASLVARPALSTIARNDGLLGEQTASQLMKDSTGIDFKPIQNASGNGIDLIGIDEKNKIIWAPEVKSSTVDSFPDANSLDLANRTDKWLSAAANNERINGQYLSAADVAYAEDIQKLLSQGYQLKPARRKVSGLALTHSHNLGVRSSYVAKAQITC